ncbi:HAMP domain-containing sensor histidine kinase [Comamonas faecalis]|uniref:histidine kinase n=1 Tax=Comamonas faecalis TaxID=1387849 RepID=A0ABP7QSV0_9BURK
MSVFSPFSRRLYLRIWLATVATMAVFALIVGYAWRVAAEHNDQVRNAPPPRQLELADAQGRVLLEGMATRLPGDWEQGVEYRIDQPDGRVLTLRMSARPRPPSHRPGPFWLQPPYGFIWMLALVGLAVTLGVFPIIRRLLQRLEQLQASVQRFGQGDLAVRAAEQGQDEVAQLARQFNAAAERIEALVQSHKSLLANASHELRSPLARIRMGLALMQDGRAAPTAHAEIERNIAELDQLVDEILLSSRLDSGVADVGDIERVDLLGLAAEECARVDAELQMDDRDAARFQEVPGISRLLRRALRNLLENARRYSQGAITLELAHEGGDAVVSICDHGPGVAADQRERIFEKFYRLPGASERSGGVGLGLALVRSIAQRHHGSVHCQPRPDGAPGACFVLRLPLQ